MEGKYFFDSPYLFILVNPRDLGRHALLKVSFMHGLGVIYYLGDAIVCYVNDDIKCIETIMNI